MGQAFFISEEHDNLLCAINCSSVVTRYETSSLSYEYDAAIFLLLVRVSVELFIGGRGLDFKTFQSLIAVLALVAYLTEDKGGRRVGDVAACGGACYSAHSTRVAFDRHRDFEL